LPGVVDLPTRLEKRRKTRKTYMRNARDMHAGWRGLDREHGKMAKLHSARLSGHRVRPPAAEVEASHRGAATLHPDTSTGTAHAAATDKVLRPVHAKDAPSPHGASSYSPKHVGDTSC